MPLSRNTPLQAVSARHSRLYEMLNNLGLELPFCELSIGEYAFAQLQETDHRQVQDAIDSLMGN